MNRGAMGVNSVPKTVTGQRRGCDLNPGFSAPTIRYDTIRDDILMCARKPT